MSLTRSELVALAKARGWTPGTKPSAALRAATKNRLEQPDAPRGRNVEGRDMTSDEATDALLEELQ